MDFVENEVNLVYGVFLICLCIILNGIVVFIGGMGFMFYKIGEVRKWFERWKESEINV